MAEQDECREHRRGLVEHLTATGQGDADAVEPPRSDRDRDEDHHVQGAVAQGPVGAVEEDPGRVEDHRQAEQQREDLVAQPERRRHREAEHVAAHRRPQRDPDRQHGRHDEAVAHVTDHVVHRHPAVPAVPHHLVGGVLSGVHGGRPGAVRCVAACGVGRRHVSMTPVGSSRLVNCGLAHRLADVHRHGAPSAVVAAVAHPPGELGHGGHVRVVGHRGALVRGVRLDRLDAGTARQGGLDGVLTGRPVQSSHVQNGGLAHGALTSPGSATSFDSDNAIPPRGISLGVARSWRLWGQALSG